MRVGGGRQLRERTIRRRFSLRAGNFAGNFEIFPVRGGAGSRIHVAIEMLAAQFPARPSREFSAAEQGIVGPEQGISCDGGERQSRF
jgi:hypothetical protein